MRFFPAPAENVLRRIVFTTALFVTPIIFTACGSPGSMGNPARAVAPTVDQVQTPPDSSSGSSGSASVSSGSNSVSSDSSSVSSNSVSGSTTTVTQPPVLLFNGTGTDDDVAAVESVLNTLKIKYATANSSQLNAMTETK